MIVGSLFAGIGGFDLGFLRAGFEVAWCVEFDKNAQAVLRARFPDAKIYGDIREVDETKLERVDVICGGFPCQDVSVAGKRVGLAGQRTGLFYDAIRIVRHINPSVLVLENVPGLLSSNHGLDFAAVLREVGEGWDCEEVAWRVLDSQYFGVAQRRNRVFIVASTAIGHAEQILALNESVCGDPPTRRAAGQDAAVDPQRSPLYQNIVGALCAGDHKMISNQYVNQAKVVVTSVAVAYRKSRRAKSNTDCETWVNDGIANTINTFDVGDTRTTHAVCAIQGNLIGRVEGGPQGVGVSVNQPMYTLTSTDVHAAVVAATGGMIVRRLTPVECERLQGFPDGWTDIGTTAKPTSDGHRYKQLGNAVTVNVAEWIARRVRSAAEVDQVKEKTP
jgi:DNA (cytosine-5)-methyltransferase 1